MDFDFLNELYHQRALDVIGLGAGQQQNNADDNRAAFVRAACSLALAPNADEQTTRSFHAVTNELREIASQLDPLGAARYRTEACYINARGREAICGRLSVLLAQNPDAAATRLTDEQRRLAATVLNLAVLQPVQPVRAAEAAEEEGEEEIQMSTAQKLAAGGASALYYAGLLYVAPIPVLTTTAAVFGAGLIARWGQPVLRRIYSAATDYKNVGAIRRALSPYATDFIGRERTTDLRNFFVRYATMDANALSQLLASRFYTDPTRNTINALLMGEIRERVAEAGNAANINRIVGRVLSDFTFGGTSLIKRMDSPNVTVFIPTAGLEQIGLRGAQDQVEFESLRNTFATTYFLPTIPMARIEDVPPDIVAFWSTALASALDQERPNAVSDAMLYTMYYFVWRYVDAYRLLQKLHCPKTMIKLGNAKTTTGRSLSSATSTFQCVFEDYERRYRESLSWTEAFYYKFGF